MARKKLVFVLGIRPDIIRASLLLRHLKKEKRVKTIFIWSGQHYSDNLKGIFLRELNVQKPVIELGCGGDTDAKILGTLIQRLYSVLGEIKPDAVVFLGDTNTVASCVAPALLNIPIVHIEGGMRSYDWRMPEEKYRIVSDHLADLIYVYFQEYKKQAVAEGVNPKNIVVVGNPIVDIVNQFYFKRKKVLDKLANEDFFNSRKIIKQQYYLMTWHRRENVHETKAVRGIVRLIKSSPYPIYFPASYRTQRVLKEMKIVLPNKVIMKDPVGYEEFLALLINSRGVMTDSGTVVEEASILQTPSIQMRHSTERPQVYDVGSSVKFDPIGGAKYPPKVIFGKLEKLFGKKWKHNLGDGKASVRIATDLAERLVNDKIQGHQPGQYHIPIDRSYREDGLK